MFDKVARYFVSSCYERIMSNETAQVWKGQTKWIYDVKNVTNSYITESPYYLLCSLRMFSNWLWLAVETKTKARSN